MKNNESKVQEEKESWIWNWKLVARRKQKNSKDIRQEPAQKLTTRSSEDPVQTVLLLEDNELISIRLEIQQKLESLGYVKKDERTDKRTSRSTKDKTPFSNFRLGTVDAANNTTNGINSKALLTSLARIIMPSRDKCACIKLENKEANEPKILWSSNNCLSKEDYQHINEVTSAFSRLATSTQGEEIRSAKKQLFRKAILRDAKYYYDNPTVTRDLYERSLKSDCKIWDDFEESLIHFWREAIEEENNFLLDLFVKRQALVAKLVELRDGRNQGRKINLNFQLFKVLLNISDFLIILWQVDNNTEWWKKIAHVFNDKNFDNSFQIVKGNKKMHAEMKILELILEQGLSENLTTKTANGIARENMQNFVNEISVLHEDCQFAVTKRLCLFCNFALCAGEQVVNKEISTDSKVTKVNRCSKMNFPNWTAVTLEILLKNDMHESFIQLYRETMQEFEKEKQKNVYAWIEEQVVDLNLQEEARSSTMIKINDFL